MSSNGSASDSAKIEVVRKPMVYAEPAVFNAVGMFKCKIERVGGLVEEFDVFNNITTPGRQALIAGIANTQRNNVYAGSAGKTGMRFSTTAAPAAGADGTKVSGFTSGANLAGSTDTVQSSSGPDDCWTRATDADIFGTGFGSNADTLTSLAIKVAASGGSSGAMTSILLVDCTSTTAADAFVFAGAGITVTLSDGDTLEATYTLTIT